MKKLSRSIGWMALVVWLAVAGGLAAQGTVVPAGSVWRYLDDGSDAGTGWRQLGFDDSSWLAGRAQLGYGDGDESTVLEYGPDPLNKPITTYFRHSFQVIDPMLLGNAQIRLWRDDGAIVYLNGVEVFRSNMPLGPVEFRTRAPVFAPQDGNAVQTNAVDVGLLNSGLNVLAVEIHQVAPDSSDISFDLELLAGVSPGPPTIGWIGPAFGSVLPLPGPFDLEVEVADPDGRVGLVEFFEDGLKIGESDGPFFSIPWSPGVPGAYLLTARATDDFGLTTDSSPLSVTVTAGTEGMDELVIEGSVWNYLDDGSDLGSGWRDLGYDDSAWLSGPAELGYGDGDEETVVGYGPDENNKYITTYFRRTFGLPGNLNYAGLLLRLKRDDGAVVYLNGVEVHRSNLPPGPIHYQTLAPVAPDDGTLFEAVAIPASVLVAGLNVVAVEVHQQAPNSSDISFDLGLYGRRSIVVVNANDSGPGSLRQAILAANDNSGRDTIQFDIAGTPRIQLLSPLPFIAEPVVIDGTSQPGFMGTPVVELSGGQMMGSGLRISASSCVIRGMCFIHFNEAGILVEGPAARRNWIHGNYVGLDRTGAVAGNRDGILLLNGTGGNLIGTDGDGVNDVEERNIISGNTRAVRFDHVNVNRVAGNHVGTDPTGTEARPNNDGIWIMGGAGNIVGTDSSDDDHNVNERNLLSGNLDRAVVLDGPNRVSGNFIGTDVTGMQPLPNQFGLQVTGASSVVGADGDGIRDEEEGNLISGNSISGIAARNPGTESTVISANLIGTDATGAGPLPNYRGVEILHGVIDCLVGGNERRLGNVIAYNRHVGVALSTFSQFYPLRNSIIGNSIHSNARLGIDLGEDGVTLNDKGDADGGENGRQNFPELEVVATDGIHTAVKGALDSEEGSYLIEFFSSAEADPSGYGEGEVYLGSTTTEIESLEGYLSGGAFEVVLPVGVPPGHVVTATATHFDGGTSEFSLAHLAKGPSPPEIAIHPTGLTLAPGEDALFCVDVYGVGPFQYQWRLNGVNIPDATNNCYFVGGVNPLNGGDYSVVVANVFGAVTSGRASLLLEVNEVRPGDDFVQRALFSAASGISRGSNAGASKEPGEPDHAGKAGGHSVWYRWIAPADGIATFLTGGSSFDTLLAVYTGSALGNLVPVVSDEDSGPFLTSQVAFNTRAGVEYQIAVDGFGRGEGNYIVIWTFEPSGAADRLPVIVSYPTAATVLPGGSHTFAVGADALMPEYQWYFNGVPIPGATGANLVVSNVNLGTVGSYSVGVRSGSRVVRTPPVSLQLNLTGQTLQEVRAEDKFLDEVAAGNPLRLGGAPGGGGRRGGLGGGGLSLGYTGTHSFNTFGSTSEAGEPNHCNVIGGASQWLTYFAEENGVFFLNTDGSNFDTLLAIYTGDANDFSALVEVACDNNSGSDGRDSSLQFETKAGVVYHIVIDGVGGATGTLVLNYSLVLPGLLTVLPASTEGFFRLRVTGREEMNFRIEGSGDFLNWFPLLETNSAGRDFDFTDPTSLGSGFRTYRALMFP